MRTRLSIFLAAHVYLPASCFNLTINLAFMAAPSADGLGVKHIGDEIFVNYVFAAIIIKSPEEAT